MSVAYRIEALREELANDFRIVHRRLDKIELDIASIENAIYPPVVGNEVVDVSDDVSFKNASIKIEG